MPGNPLWSAVRGAWLWAGAALALLALRLYRARLVAPEGRELVPRQAPRLFHTLAKMQARMNGPRIDRVLVDGALHARVWQQRRFGWFGRPSTVLLLGMPGLLAASPRELLSMVARDYAHLCGHQRHQGSSSLKARWRRSLHRQRRALDVQYQHLDSPLGQPLPAWLRRALDAFMPSYRAHLLPLARRRELVADRTASVVFGSAANASALVRISLLEHWIDSDFWPTLYRQADHRPRPTFMPFGAMQVAFKASHAAWAKPELLAAVWAAPAGPGDSRPALRERVIACGQKLLAPPPVVSSAAEILLGRGTTRQLVNEFDRAWWTNERQAWRAYYGELRRSRNVPLALPAPSSGVTVVAP